jgi:hypothetical protein
MSFTACGTSGPDRDKGKEATVKDSTLTAELPVAINSDSLDQAKAGKKPIFLVITGTGATEVEKASRMVQQAKMQVKNSLLYSLNRDNASNGELVTRFGIATVPLPFILVISPNGVPVAGGQPAQLTVDQIAKSIPSPKQDEVFEALMEKKPVFIVVSRKDYQDKEGVLSTCIKASAGSAAKPAIVEIDFEDTAEQAFLAQIGIRVMNGTTVTVVINSAGQVTETITQKPTITQLNAAAAKVIKQSSGCCPAGSGKGCG